MQTLKNIFWSGAFGISIAIFALTFAACKKNSQISDAEIRVGEYGSMTGSEATFGISTHRGLQMVIEETNAKGGVKGKQLKLISVDDGGKPEEAVTGVTKLIAHDQVHVLIGEVASSRSLAAAPIAQRHQVPMISPSSTNPKVTEVGNYIFRVCFIDPFQGEVLAKFAATDLKAKRAGILLDKKSDYSVGLAEAFKKVFTAQGGTIVLQENYVGGDIDFKAQLTNLKAANPQVILVPGYYTEAGLILKQAKELGIDPKKTPFLGGDGWDSTKLREIGGDAINGSYFSNHYSVDDKDPKVQDFVKRYKTRFGEVPDGLAVMGYDAGLVMVDALNRATDLSRRAIRDAIAATKSFPGVTGVITIDDKRNASKPAVVLRIDKGEFAFVKRVNP